MKRKIIVWAFLITTLMVTPGCIVLSGGSRAVAPPPATIGQQLMDLQTAKARGIITEAEFEAAKARILRER